MRKLFIPTAVIGGFLVFGLGPEGLGRFLGGTGLFPENGLPAFTIAAAAITGALITWGIKRVQD